MHGSYKNHREVELLASHELDRGESRRELRRKAEAWIEKTAIAALLIGGIIQALYAVA